MANTIQKNEQQSAYLQFLFEIKERIHKSRYEAAKVVNQEIIQLYWDIGRSITEKQQTLGWGKSVVETLSEDLQKEFPGMPGFGKSNLWSMAQFYTEYHSDTILQPLVGEISWSKHYCLRPMKLPKNWHVFLNKSLKINIL
jgi:predicted nuclease of restriction endonuclease-like (RecB) superfamily